MANITDGPDTYRTKRQVSGLASQVGHRDFFYTSPDTRLVHLMNSGISLNESRGLT